MPVGAQGGSFKLRAKVESSENTAPTGNWDQLPCFTFGLAGEQEQGQDQILSANASRDATDPFYGKTTVSGSARVPLESVHIGKWLKWMLGAPTTTGSSPDYTHVFKSGAATLPSVAFEKALPDISAFETYLGGRVNTMEVGISDTGGADATFGLLAMQEVLASSTGAGTPVVTAFSRFQRPTGAILLGGSALAAVTGGTIRFTNDMVAVDDTIRDDAQIEGIDIGQSAGSGDLTLRFASHDQVNLAVAGTAVAIEYSLTIAAATSITFTYPRAFLRRTGRPVEGPRGISMSLPFVAAYDTTAGCLLKVTLLNQVASY